MKLVSFGHTLRGHDCNQSGGSKLLASVLGALSVAAMLVAPQLAAQTLPLSTPIPVDSAVRTGKLANGIHYYVRHNGKPEQRAELRLVVNAGSILEENDQRGLAHFVEHMAFNGTTHFAKNDIIKYLESIGVRFGADLNASTGFDETVYILPVPTDSAGILERSMQFLHDVATGITFDSASVVAERGVVLSEWRDGLGVGERLRNEQIPVLFRGSRYAERLPIGDTAILEHANPAPLKRFWKDWYRPDLIAVIAVGDANPDSLERLIRTTFGDIPMAARPRARATASVPLHDSTLVSIVPDPELTSSSVSVTWKLPPRTTKTVGDMRRNLMDDLYDQMINQRFTELSLKPGTPFIAAGSSSGSIVRSSSHYSLDAASREGKIIESLQALLTEAERVRQHGFLSSELDRARANMLRAYDRMLDERDKTPSSSFVNSYINHFLTGDAIPSVDFEHAAAKQLLNGITLAEMNGLAGERGGAANRVVLISLPQKDGLSVPTEAQVRSVFAQVVAANVAAWVDNSSDEPLVSAIPAPGKVVGERTIDVLGATEWTMSNGVRVLVKQTDFKADQVLMTSWAPGGVSLAQDADVYEATLSPFLIERGGAGAFNLAELVKKLTGKVANVAASTGELSAGFTGTASPRDLNTMFELLWLRMTAPRGDSAVFQTIVPALQAQLQNKDADPGSVFSDTVQIALFNGSPRARPIDAGIIGELDLQSSLAWYRRFFGNAAGYTFVFVGNVSPETLKPLAERWLGALPVEGRAESPREVSPRLFTGQITKRVAKGLAPQSISRVVLHGDAKWSADESYLLGSLAQLLEARLLDRLREDLGGTYSVNVSAVMSRRMRQEWQMQINFTSSPENADRMFAAVEQELDSLRRFSPSADEVERVREQQRRELEVARKQNSYWLGILRSRAENGDPLDAPLLDETRISGLNAERIREAASRYLDETNRARFVLLPEKAGMKPY